MPEWNENQGPLFDPSGEPIDEWLPSGDAARLAHMSVVTLWRMRQRGEGPRYRMLTPKLVLYRRVDVERWLESRTVEPTGDRAGV